MKISNYIAAIALFAVIPLYAQVQTYDINPVTLSYIRNEFYLSIENEDKAEDLIKFLKDSFYVAGKKVPARATAYAGAVEAVMAKHVFNPYSKYKYVTRGLKKLNKAVEEAPGMLEVRFLRFAVLHNIPAIFGIGEKRKSDLDAVYELLLEKNYTEVNYDLQKGIAEFLIHSERISPDQQDNLLHLFSEIRIQ